MNKEEFIKELKKINIDIDAEKLNKLDVYYNFLIEYNTHTNITAIKEEADVYLKHFYDSLTICKECDLNQELNVIDIGSGAGFPGVVLKIFFPNIKLTVLDSNGKKTKFIQQLIDKLNLKEVEVVNERAEDYAKSKLNSYDLCISRAVAYIDIITELSLPFIKLSGKVILMKGDISNETEILSKYQRELNIAKYEINSFKLPKTNDIRKLIVITKKDLTKKIMIYSQIIKRNKKWNSCK